MIDYFAKANKAIGLFSSPEPQRDASHAQPADVIHAAVEKGLTIATAESCTGGMVGAALTSVAGSSEAYLGGIVSYANQVKQDELGVPAADLDAFGAVSPQVAEQMAKGACEACHATISVSTTGIAGPGGGSAEKPVGTVCFGVNSPRGVRSCVEHFSGDRKSVRESSVQKAMDLLMEEIEATG
ncbi:MAG: CinA family protein [Coriobacteriales bacterium]|nr:CinA family protein [Coriobacteriales bacterium]MBQ6586763.1 CinA family protein [Coriobacteriales bacterium]